jgi:MarR family transcriptional regulator, temperature-dependent positive regulator of motility
MPKRSAPPESSFDRPADAVAVPATHRVPSFLSYLLRQVCLGIMTEVLTPADLRPVEYAILTTVDAEPGLDQRRLAARLAIDKMSASQLVARLERKGFVRRRVDRTDRRARRLHLTPKGRALRRRLQPGALAAQDRILAPLSRAERPLFIDLMTRVIEGHRRYARPGNGRRAPRRSRRTDHRVSEKEKA